MKRGHNRFKVKKNLILLLILFISIGFAFLTTNLFINSTIGYNSNSWDIYFDNINEKTYKSSTITETTISNKTTLDFSVMLDQPSSVYTLYADIKNNGTLDAILDSWTVTNTLSETEAKAIDIRLTYSNGSKEEANGITVNLPTGKAYGNGYEKYSTAYLDEEGKLHIENILNKSHENVINVLKDKVMKDYKSASEDFKKLIAKNGKICNITIRQEFD